MTRVALLSSENSVYFLISSITLYFQVSVEIRFESLTISQRVTKFAVILIVIFVTFNQYDDLHILRLLLSQTHILSTDFLVSKLLSNISAYILCPKLSKLIFFRFPQAHNCREIFLKVLCKRKNSFKKHFLGFVTFRKGKFWRLWTKLV